jgi:hypothetical protein
MKERRIEDRKEGKTDCQPEIKLSALPAFLASFQQARKKYRQNSLLHEVLQDR